MFILCKNYANTCLLTCYCSIRKNITASLRREKNYTCRCVPHRIPFKGVLVLAGIELIFFTVASTELCFGFVLKTVLIMQRCFCYC